MVAVEMVMLIVVRVMVVWTPQAIATFFSLAHPHCPILLGQLSSPGWDIVFQIRVVNSKEIKALLQHHFQGAVYCAKNLFFNTNREAKFLLCITVLE